MESVVYCCPFCRKELKSQNACNSHKWKCKQNPEVACKEHKGKSEAWYAAMHARKGKGTNQYTRAKELGLPKPVLSDETRKKLSLASKGDRNPSHRSEVRAKISKSMKKAHAEGRAHNIGECRWNNKPSYPEEWFMKVLLNEFSLEEGKDYRREYPFHKFSLDFAWPEKKLCVEIDGEQHHRFQEQMARDTEKDSLLLKEGWSEIREDWKAICANPKGFIERVKNFIQ